MNITLNISLNVGLTYLPKGVAEMHLQHSYVVEYLEKALGKPTYIGLAESATEETVVAQYATKETIVAQYTKVEAVLFKLYRLADELQQDYIAYRIQDDDGVVLGGALVGKYAHAQNYGIFNEEYFIQTA